MSIETTLEERGNRYGSFAEHAEIAQAIQEAFRVHPHKWQRLPPVVKQGFSVIADKIARTLNGDEFYEDNYHDIGGYSRLIEDWVKEQNRVRAIQPAPVTYEVPGVTVESRDIPLFSDSLSIEF